MKRQESVPHDEVRRLIFQQVDEVGVDWGGDPDEDEFIPRVRVDSVTYSEVGGEQEVA